MTCGVQSNSGLTTLSVHQILIVHGSRMKVLTVVRLFRGTKKIVVGFTYRKSFKQDETEVDGAMSALHCGSGISERILS